MGVDVTTNLNNVRTHYNWSSWQLCLDLAIKYGWRPKGTEAPLFIDEKGRVNQNLSIKPENWSGSYCSNSYQHVTTEDAQNIAVALGAAILDKSPQVDSEFLPVLRDFINICKHGGFYIG